MSKISEEQMIQFINENIDVLPATTKAGLDKYDTVTKYRKVRYYKNLAEKKNQPEQVTANVVDQVMNIIKNSTVTACRVFSIIWPCSVIELFSKSDKKNVETQSCIPTFRF
jgi:hypothetical protein